MGSGKTLSMVYEAYQYYKKGFKVFANFRLNFPYTRLTKRVFDAMVENKTQLTHCVVLIDEIHIWLDSRSSMQKKNKMITYWILMTRKASVRLLCTTQHLHQVDKRLRDTIDILVFCKNRSNKTSIVSGTDGDLWIEQEFVFQWAEQPPQKRLLYGNPVYPMYDTTEMIDINDASDDDDGSTQFSEDE